MSGMLDDDALRRREPCAFFGACSLRIVLAMSRETGGLRKRSTRSGSNCVPLPSSMIRRAVSSVRA
jgi:hypothetical protein